MKERKKFGRRLKTQEGAQAHADRWMAALKLGDAQCEQELGFGLELSNYDTGFFGRWGLERADRMNPTYTATTLRSVQYHERKNTGP